MNDRAKQNWIESLRIAIDEAIKDSTTVHWPSPNTAPISSSTKTYLKNDELATKELDKFNNKKNEPP